MDKGDSMESSSDSDMEMEEKFSGDIAKLKAQLQENNQHYESHVELIKLYRKIGDLQEMRLAYDNMHQVFPLSPELWMEWLADEQKISSTDEEKEHVASLFDLAVQDYTSVKIWVEYIMFSLQKNDMQYSRRVYDRALMSVGTHIAEGILVWQAILLLEQQHYAVLQSEGNAQMVEEQKKLIQNLYRRLARVPLMNVTEDEFVTEASLWFDGEIPKQILNDLKNSLKKMQTKYMKHEDKLLQCETELEKCITYQEYITELTKTDTPTAVQSLYERSLADLCLYAALWEDYIQFIRQKFPGADYMLLPASERGQRNCPWSGALCELRILVLEEYKEKFGKDKTNTVVKECLERGLSSGIMCSEVMQMWMAYLTYLRRGIDWEDEGKETQVKHLRKTCQDAISYIDSTFGEEGGIESHIPCWWAMVEAESVKDMSSARAVWNDIIMKRNNNYQRHKLWMEFITLERSFGTEKHVRKLFRRALERVWDDVELVGKAFMRFEQEVGTLDTLNEFYRRYKDRMAIVMKKRHDDKQKETAKNQKDESQDRHSKHLSATSNEGGRKRKIIEEDQSYSSSSKISKQDNSDAKWKDLSTMPETSQSQEGNQTSPSKAKVNPNHGEFVKDDQSKDHRRVFLSNLDYSVEPSQIIPIFSDCGQVEDISLAKDYKGRSKGFGYLTFVDSSCVLKALKKDRTRIENRPMFVSLCRKENRDSAFKFSMSEEKDKLFVQGLAWALREEDIRKAFEEHAKVKSIRLVTYRNGHSKGNCYIQFCDEETAENVRQKMDGQVLCDKKIRVFISNPKLAKANTGSSNSVAASSITGGRNQNTQRPQLALMPRALLRKDKSTASATNGIHSNTNNLEVKSTSEVHKPMSNEDFKNLVNKK